jgi:2'-5' RNA ligase
MAFLGLKVPPEIGKLFEQFTVPGNREQRDRYHITVLYLGSEVSIDGIAKATEAAYGVASRARPFQVSSRLVTSFPAGDDGVPIIAKIESPELMMFQAALKVAFKSSGVSFNDKYPEYKPHVTLAYSDAGTDMPDQPIPPISWTVSELVLWGGDEGERRIVVQFPLEFDVAAALRVASRFQRGT